MNNILHNKGWISRSVHIYLESPTIPLIKINLDMKSEKDCVRIKLRINPTWYNSGMY